VLREGLPSGCEPIEAAALDHVAPESFVELRGRPWLVEAILGEAKDIQTVVLSCIADDAQGEPLEVIWDAEIGPECWTRMGGVASAKGLPTAPRSSQPICPRSDGGLSPPPTGICFRRRSGLASGWTPTSLCLCARRCGCLASIC
jgi:hypothetical protein